MAFAEYKGEVLPYSFEDEAIDKVMSLEGGYNPKDPVTGRPVKYGIDQVANPDIDVSKLSKEDARNIYRDRYWKKSGAEDLPRDLALVHFDAAVNQGPEKAKQLLEESGGDVNKYIELRKAEYQRLAEQNPQKYGSSLKGWMNRLDKISASAKPQFAEYDGEVLPLEEKGVLGKAKDYISEQADLLTADAKIGIINAKMAVTQNQIAGLMELQEADFAKYGKDLEGMPSADKAKHMATRKKLEEYLGEIAKYSTEIKGVEKEYGARESTKQMFEKLPQTEEYQNASTFDKFKMLGSEFIKDPVGIITDLGIKNLPTSLAVAAPAIAARMGNLNPKMSALAGGTSSAMTQFGGEYAKLREEGMPHIEAWEKAGVKSGVVGLFDAASFMTAGNAAEKIISNIGKGTKQVAKETAKEVAKETGRQAGLGAAGEAAGSAVIGQEIEPADIAGEALGEIFSAPGEAVGTYRGKKAGAATFKEVPPDTEIIPIRERKEPTFGEKPEPVATPEEAAKFETAPEIEITGTAETKPEEKPLVAGQDTDVMMAELEGRLPKKEAEEVKAEAPVEEEAPKETVTMFKDYSPEDQKAIRTMEIEKNKIAKEKKLFPEFLRRQGIQPSEKADLGLENVSRPGIFKKNAPTFDELTSRAISQGFLLSTGDDVQDVENFREHVRDYIGSGIISTGPDVAREAQIGAIDDAIQEIARKYEKPAFGLEETTPAQLRADEEKRKAREAEAARIEAEDQARRDREEIARLSQSSEFALGKTAAEDLMGQKSVFDEPVAEEPAQPKTMKALAAKTPQLAEELRALPRENMNQFEREAMEIADRIESYDEANSATGIRAAVKSGRIKSDKDLDFYRQREKDYAARVGKAEEAVSEKLSMDNFMEGYESDQKRLREANELFATKTSDLLDKTNEYLQELVDVVNRRGYKFLDINTASPFDVQDTRDLISQMAGSMNLVLKQTEAFRKGYDRANEKKLEDAVVALTKDFKEADTIIDMSKQAEISKAEAERMKKPGEDEDIPFFSPTAKKDGNIELYSDIPNESWLKNKKQYSSEGGRKPSGAPRIFGTQTGKFILEGKVLNRKRNVLMPVDVLARIKGENSEQQNVRQKDLEAIKKIMSETGRLPQGVNGDYVPYINVDQDGNAYVNEGNHRIMAAKALGFKYLPVEIVYFNGGERERYGDIPPKDVITYDMQAHDDGYSLDKYSPDIEALAPSTKQTDTPAFKKWFGDSKVVDEDGIPMVVYHGTPYFEGNEFKPSSRINRGGNIAGFYFSPDREFDANQYAKEVDGSQIIPVYLSIQNPYTPGTSKVTQAMRDQYRKEIAAANQWMSDEKLEEYINSKAGYLDRTGRPYEDAIGADGDAFQRIIKSGGYDGYRDGRHWVAFDSSQIKSAIGNRGTFSAEEADITLAPRKERTSREIIHDQILEAKIRELQGLSQRKRGVERRFVKDKSKETDAQYYKSLDVAIRGLKEDIADMKEPNISAEQFVANAARSLANKKDGITKEVFDVIKAIYDKNPKLLEGLRLSVKTSEKPAAGEFEPNSRIVSLYKGTEGLTDPSVIRHEITHTLEQMMSTDAKLALVNAWAKAAVKAQKQEKTEAGKKFFEKVAEMIAKPNRETFYEAIELLPKDKEGKPNLDYYQYITPSEYWAVNAESLMDSYLGGAWQRFKTYVRALFEALKNKFGFDNKSIFHKTFKDIINGERKSNLTLNNYINAITKIPTFAPHKTIFGEKALSTWTAPDESKLADFIYKVQDKNIDLKNVQKAITTQVGEIEDSWNAYQKEELYHGRTAKRIADFLKNELQPIVKELSKAGLSLKQFDDFLHNRHAEERNRQIAKINPLFPDGGSGIKTEDAKKYMDNLSPEDFAAMDKIASKIDKMVRETQDILVDNGLEDAETIKAWRKTYKHYAPLYRADLDFVHDSFGTGQGMSTRGGSTKRATGSEKEVVNIFANIAMQRERAIIRAEKARVGRALYGLAIKNPNADFWLPVNPDAIKDPKALAEELQSLGLSQSDAVNFVKEPTTPEVDPNTGLVVNRIKLNSRYSDNVFAIRVNGKDRFIFFNPSNEEAMRLVKSFKNMDAEQLGIVLGTIGRITRFIAAMNTQYNPVFGAWNFTRDVGGAMVNLSTTPIADKKAKVMAGVFPALRGIYKDLRSERKGKAAPDNEWSKLWERYQNAGGQTGYRDQFAITPKNQVQQEQATEKTAKTLGKSMAQWLERKTKSKNIIEKEMAKLSQGNIKNTVDAVAGLLSDYNDAMENAVRLSAFKAALDKGLSEDQAASIAKNLTVNFNRKGQISTNMGALYAFFNASVQGTARIAETLTGPSGKKIIAGGMLLGVMQAVMLMMAGFDDDEPPEFLKDKNLIIPTGDGKYAVIPLPLGLAFIPALGRRITEAVVAGDKLPKRILGMMGAFADAFNPIGTGSFAQMLSPTVADPFVSIGMNKDSFGRPIYKEDRSTNPTPGYSRSRDGASAISKGIAEFLNWASGGTKYQKGEISPTADEIDYLAGQITGGVGRETQKAFETAKGLITGEEVEPHRKPITGKIMGDINSKQAVSAKFYSNVTELAKLEAEVKGRAENQEGAYEVFRETPKARLIDMANDAENDISSINKDIKEIKKRYPDNKEAVKRMEDAKLRIMRKLNARVKELEE